jgi:GTP cyclohydrolase I
MSGERIRYLSWDAVQSYADAAFAKVEFKSHPIKVYGVPRGGMIATTFLSRVSDYKKFIAVELPEFADVILDDIVDSGRTREEYKNKYPDVPFVALIDKTADSGKWKGVWIQFPWECSLEDDSKHTVQRILEQIGEDPSREGLRETPERVVRSWKELFAGYSQDPVALFKTFEEGACDEMVLLKDIEFYSTCEHHMLPFYGKAHVAFIPDGRVIGVSKLARLLDVFARRLQIQERIGTQVTDILMEHLKPKGAACILEAQHFCMTSRGVQKQNSVMVTSSLRGAFIKDSSARAELMGLCL